MRGVSQKHGGSYQQDQTPEVGPVGGQPGGQDERGETELEVLKLKVQKIV